MLDEGALSSAYDQAFDLVLTYPQWQGSGRGENLLRGALATTLAFWALGHVDCVPASLRRGSASGVNRLEAIIDQLEAAQEILARRAPSRILTAGGDCAVDIGIIDYLVGRYPGLTVIWIDSHFDANTPATSPSGNLHGMSVAAIMGDAPAAMRPKLHHPLSPERFRYVWANVSDEGERAFQAKRDLRWLDEAEPLHGPVHVHFDLDALSPEDFPYVAYPELSGMPLCRALKLMRWLSNADIVGLTFTEFAPSTPADAAAGVETIAALYGQLRNKG